MHKRCLCRRAASVRPSVCLSVLMSAAFVYCVKNETFLPSDSHTILVFWYPTLRQYSDMDPLKGASNAGVLKMAIFI